MKLPSVTQKEEMVFKVFLYALTKIWLRQDGISQPHLWTEC